MNNLNNGLVANNSNHSQNELTFTKILITPSMAKSYLENNSNNRKLRTAYVIRYANDMKNGKWIADTAECVKISKSGKVLDGQHRLMAIVKANVPVYMLVAFNVEDNVFDVLDTGATRSASDVFHISGVKNSNSLPSIIAYYNMLVENKIEANVRISKNTNASLLEQYYDNKQYWDKITKHTYHLYNSFAKILPPSAIGGFYCYLSDLDPINAEKFMNQLCTGTDAHPVINLLRNRLMQDKVSPRKVSMAVKAALIIKTWNFYKRNQCPRILIYNTVNETFPIAIK